MKFFIREWSDTTIVLMNESGHVLAYFSSVAEALEACSEWYNCHRSEQKFQVQVQYRHSKSDYASITAMAS